MKLYFFSFIIVKQNITMELFTLLPDDIKILIITEFTGQFKMRNGNLIQQIDRDVINNMNDLFNQIPKPIVFPKNLNYRDIIYLNITNDLFGQYTINGIFDDDDILEFHGYLNKWYTIEIIYNATNKQYTKLYSISSEIKRCIKKFDDLSYIYKKINYIN